MYGAVDMTNRARRQSDNFPAVQSAPGGEQIGIEFVECHRPDPLDGEGANVGDYVMVEEFAVPLCCPRGYIERSPLLFPARSEFIHRDFAWLNVGAPFDRIQQPPPLALGVLLGAAHSDVLNAAIACLWIGRPVKLDLPRRFAALPDMTFSHSLRLFCFRQDAPHEQREIPTLMGPSQKAVALSPV